MRRPVPVLLVLAVLCLMHVPARAQSITGALIGTVKDTQGAVIQGANVRVVSPSLIGGSHQTTTNAKGQFRFPALPPGVYALEIQVPGFTTRPDKDIRIGVGATIERTVILSLEGVQAVGVRRGVRLADRSAREWPRGALRPRRSPGHSGSPIQHVRLHPCGARRLGDVARQHDDQQRFGVRIGDE